MPGQVGVTPETVLVRKSDSQNSLTQHTKTFKFSKITANDHKRSGIYTHCSCNKRIRKYRYEWYKK